MRRSRANEDIGADNRFILRSAPNRTEPGNLYVTFIARGPRHQLDHDRDCIDCGHPPGLCVYLGLACVAQIFLNPSHCR
jgi:hypothetical protein